MKLLELFFIRRHADIILMYQTNLYQPSVFKLKFTIWIDLPLSFSIMVLYNGNIIFTYIMTNI